MKRIKMLAAAAIFCTAGFAGYTTYDKATMTDEEKFMLANLEALTETESTTCSYNQVNINEEKHSLKCKGKGSQCCEMN